MGRMERRETKQKALKCLRELDGYVLVGVQKHGPPRCYYDVSQCQDEKDVRHQFMIHMRVEAQTGVDMVIKFAQKNNAMLDQEIRAKHYREQRSAELGKLAGETDTAQP